MEIYFPAAQRTAMTTPENTAFVYLPGASAVRSTAGSSGATANDQRRTTMQEMANQNGDSQLLGKRTSPGRGPKPQPLKLVEDNNEKYMRHVNLMQPEQMTTEQILELMQSINAHVKTGQFTSQLANKIFKLYQQMKMKGELLEQSNKNELNRVFVSLRQACCRDAGTLGTPCRLKIMEMVELRAMGWRPNLAHSQYYLNKGGPPPETLSQSGGGMCHSSFQGAPVVSRHNEYDQAAIMAAQAAPISAPPFGSVPMNPFAFAPGPSHGTPHLQMSNPMDFIAHNQHNAVVSSSGAPSYYLIPANGGPFMHGGGMMPPSSPMGPPPVTPIFSHAPSISQQGLMNLAAVQGMVQPPPQGSPNHPGSPIEVTTPWPKGAVVKPSIKYPRPQKIPGKNQFRDEVIIKNADSGKIMGVKGRRVAVVEEISKTIISFQKVAQGAKERTLTITGNTEESIIGAKLLIEETVRRNVSPSRPEMDVGPDCEDLHELSVAERKQLEDENSNLLYTIDNGDNGVLKLTCANPQVLHAAQQALSQFFLTRNNTELTDEEKRLRKERRKSMPSFSPEGSRASSSIKDDQSVIPRNRRDSIHASERTPSRERKDDPLEQRKNSLMSQSTPNLGPDGKVKMEDTDDWRGSNEFRPERKPLPPVVQPICGPHIVYTRDFLLQIADSPQVKHCVENMLPKPDQAILQEPPHNFSGAGYKSHCIAMRSAQLTRTCYE